MIILGSDGLLLCTHSEPDSDSPPSLLVSDATFDPERAFAYLEKQCEFGARVPGTPVHQETGAYLFTELEKFADEVIFQPFEFRQQNQTIQMNNILSARYKMLMD